MKRVTDDMETVEGQITFRRALSKRLVRVAVHSRAGYKGAPGGSSADASLPHTSLQVFFDLQRTQSAIEGDAKDIWVEVVVKQARTPPLHSWASDHSVH
jgi:hypothetical protein